MVWPDWVMDSVFHYNVAQNAALGCSPFFALHGYQPGLVIEQGNSVLLVDVVDYMLPAEVHFMVNEQQFCKRAKRHATVAPGTTVPAVQVGSRVYRKVKYSPVTTNKKCAPLFTGPYEVVEVFGNVAVISTDGGMVPVPVDQLLLAS